MDIRMDVMIDRKRDGRIKARMHGGWTENERNIDGRMEGEWWEDVREKRGDRRAMEKSTVKIFGTQYYIFVHCTGDM
jgi:hypothetical protein